ncbi:uncharacterized protein FOBCDRAFT_148606 [Fusarium oxysporum Fo47]|uniref:uncharacterized protein n=1 Tax=Fusarium oxysporum Fo47 TaxID=660027 RepID=UPI002869CE8F|nr:uncharacterized protein FOBCDRAFT_148606 [Fusarium oxysporum Fo47]WJG37088.1 hypothetical protein FOBCDRAFT_148606 [Fusarium oxysporum Fo47]
MSSGPKSILVLRRAASRRTKAKAASAKVTKTEIETLMAPSFMVAGEKPASSWITGLFWPPKESMKPDGWILGILENVHYSDATNLSGEIAHYGKTGQMETDQGPTTLLDNLSSVWFSLRLGLIIASFSEASQLPLIKFIASAPSRHAHHFARPKLFSAALDHARRPTDYQSSPSINPSGCSWTTNTFPDSTVSPGKGSWWCDPEFIEPASRAVARLISKSNAPDSLALRIGFVTQEKMNSGHGREPPASAKCLTNLEKAYLTPASRNCPSVDKRNLTSRSATNIQNSRASAHQPSAASRQHVTKRGLLSTNNARRLQHFPRGTENFLLHNPNDTHSRNQGTGTKFPRHSTTRHKQQVLPSVMLQKGKILQASEEKNARNSHLPSSAQPKQGNLADRQGQDCHVGNDIRDRDAGKPYAFINACTLCGGHAPSLPDGPTLEYGEETDRDPPHENDNTKRVSTNLHGS